MGERQGGAWSRWLVVAFYVVLVVFAGLNGGPAVALSLLIAAVFLLTVLRPVEAGRAIRGWARLLHRSRRVGSPS